jgi:hypothetical protein
MKNRKKFGRAGLGGLGAQATDLSDTLARARAARTAQELSDKERAAAVLAQERLASDPQTAAMLALTKQPELPTVQIPAARPIPKAVLIVGGVVAAGLVVLIAKQLFGGKS